MNHSRNLILTSYDKKYHHTCGNYTFHLKLYCKFVDKVDLYSPKIGETASTDFNNQGFWLKINVPQKPYPFERCRVLVSAANQYFEDNVFPGNEKKYISAFR